MRQNQPTVGTGGHAGEWTWRFEALTALTEASVSVIMAAGSCWRARETCRRDTNTPGGFKSFPDRCPPLKKTPGHHRGNRALMLIAAS